MLEECGEAYDFIDVDLMAAEHKGDAYRALNPTARVPTLVDGDFVLWESNAILEYLAAKHPETTLGPTSPRETGEIARFIDRADALRRADAGDRSRALSERRRVVRAHVDATGVQEALRLSRALCAAGSPLHSVVWRSLHDVA